MQSSLRRFPGKFILGLQMDYDLDVAEDELGEKLNEEVTIFANQ